MSKMYKFLLVLLITLIVLLAGWFIYKKVYVLSMRQDIKETAIDTSVFKPYILGERIDFSEQGNSTEYVKISDGWGGQEPEHRCAVGKNTVMKRRVALATPPV